MEISFNKFEDNNRMDTEEITIGKTTYVVKTNAKSVSSAFVKKTVQKMLFDTLKQEG